MDDQAKDKNRITALQSWFNVLTSSMILNIMWRYKAIVG